MQTRRSARRGAGPCPGVGGCANQSHPSCPPRSRSSLSLAASPIDSAPNKAAIKPRGLLRVLKGEVLNVWCSNPSPAALRGRLLPSNREAKVSLRLGLCLSRRCWASRGSGGSWPARNTRCCPLGASVSWSFVWQKSSQSSNPVSEVAVWSGIFSLLSLCPVKRPGRLEEPAWRGGGGRRGCPELGWEIKRQKNLTCK